MHRRKIVEEETTIILADDHTLVRQGFIALLNETKKCKVIGEAANGKELLDLLKLKQPDIVLLDIQMPVMNGRQALDLIVKRYPKVKVMMLSMHVESNLIFEFLSKGAKAFLPKETDAEMLLEAIMNVKTKGYYYSSEVADALHQNLQNKRRFQNAFHEIALTSRELAVLKLICNGKTNTDIAKELNITYNTVDFHRRNLYAKTQAKNLADLIKYGIKYQINGFE